MPLKGAETATYLVINLTQGCKWVNSTGVHDLEQAVARLEQDIDLTGLANLHKRSERTG